MRVNRGCGCLLLVLALVNAIFVVSAVIGIAQEKVTVVYGALLLLMFCGNIVASGMVGLAGIRRQALGGAATSSQGQAVIEGEEGSDTADEDVG